MQLPSLRFVPVPEPDENIQLSKTNVKHDWRRTSCNNLSFLATTLFSPSFSNRSLYRPSFKSSFWRVSWATLRWLSLSCVLVFSSALRALTTPVWRSASTLVVPPGVSEMRRDAVELGWPLGDDGESDTLADV